MDGSGADKLDPEPFQLHVIGMGPEMNGSWSSATRKCLQTNPWIAGSLRHLQQVEAYGATKVELKGSPLDWIPLLAKQLQQHSAVLLASGDPLFFGIGRLLLEHFPPSVLVFHPHISSVQLAFSRLRIPWQSATVVSVHGRDPSELIRALQRGLSPIAVLTDGINTPAAIARIIQDLRLPVDYRFWVCSELGLRQERVQELDLVEAQRLTFPFLNLVVLQKQEVELPELPLLGIPDRSFYTFEDRPGLITKQEVRVLTLAQLQLQPEITVWDVGAGTGSLSIELARLVPSAKIFAIESHAAGVTLIKKNCQRFGVNNIQTIPKSAPDCLDGLPQPDRILLGGGGRDLPGILDLCCQRLKSGGVLVGNFATLESLVLTQETCQSLGFSVQMLQINLARSVRLSSSSEVEVSKTATRFAPLNPVTVLQAIKPKDFKNTHG